MQLRKNPPFEINADDPFENDKLNQQSTIQLLSKLVQSTDQPFVITIEAPWGWGKTKFIERWKAHLVKENHTCLYFNAWENDFVTDPLVAFIGELRPVIEKVSGGEAGNSSIKKGFNRLCKIGSSLSKHGAPIVVKAVASKALGNDAVREVSEVIADSAGELAEAISDSVKKEIEKYDEEKNGIKKFKKLLKFLAQKIANSADHPRQLIFFVDELDRCRPDFAMTLLERIKHLFNVENIVFVLALDREQLRNTVRYLYGSGENADAYLRRFIDFSFQLPKPSTRSFAELLSDRFQMLSFFRSGRANAQVEHDRFLPVFVDTANWLNIDLRTQEQCFTRLNAIFRLHDPRDYIPTDAFSVLVGLRVGKPELYESLRSKRVSIKEALPQESVTYESRDFPTLAEATLYVWLNSDKAILDENDRLTRELADQTDSQITYKTNLKIRLYEHLRLNRSKLIQMTEFANSFS